MLLNVKLVVVGGDVKTTEVDLRLPSTVGRGRDTSIVLPHPLVSRQHCELYEADGHLMVRDLGSLNGTFVNNEKVTESPLKPGELLTIGTVTFRAVYELDGADSSTPATTAKPAPGDKTVQVAKAPTLPVKSKPAPPKPAKNDSADDLEFNPTGLPGEEEDSDEHPGATYPTERLTAPAEAEQADEDEVDAEDDDLGDFLSSLGKK